MECCASVSTRKSAGLPPLSGLSKARGWVLSPVPFSFSTLPALVPWSLSPVVQGFHSSSVPASLATHTLVSLEMAPLPSLCFTLFSLQAEFPNARFLRFRLSALGSADTASRILAGPPVPPPSVYLPVSPYCYCILSPLTSYPEALLSLVSFQHPPQAPVPSESSAACQTLVSYRNLPSIPVSLSTTGSPLPSFRGSYTRAFCHRPLGLVHSP